jgi:hypothetical protein
MAPRVQGATKATEDMLDPREKRAIQAKGEAGVEEANRGLQAPRVRRVPKAQRAILEQPEVKVLLAQMVRKARRAIRAIPATPARRVRRASRGSRAILA